MKKIIMILIGFIPIFLSGCASIVSRGNQLVGISTEPDDAEIIIRNSKGRVVHKAKSPTNVSLVKSDGYFSGEAYSVNIKKEGYSGKEIIIDSTLSGWYLFGNLGFGGLIGWFIVDPLTGAMYKLEPDEVNVFLEKK